MAETLSIKKAKSVVEEVENVQQRILSRAYEIFNANGGVPGKDLDNWLQAERELVWKPAIELEEKDNDFRLQMALPGIEPKDIEIEVTPEDMLVRADIRHEHEAQIAQVHICEFASGNLFRSIHFPKDIEPDKVKAEFKNGILYLKAQIAQEARAKKAKTEAA